MAIAMKKNQFIAIIGVCVLCIFFGPSALAQLSGTENPASYKEKDRVIAREERVRRSQTIQEVAQTYREMVAAYKANRILRAEEMSQQLDSLLEDPILPEAFSDRVRKKQERFLGRVYGDMGYVKMDVPEDNVSDAEVAQIRKSVQLQKGPEPSRVSLDNKIVSGIVAAPSVQESLTPEDLRSQREQARLAEKRARLERLATLREERRQKKIAAQGKKKEARLARKAKSEAAKMNKIQAVESVESKKDIIRSKKDMDSVDRKLRRYHDQESVAVSEAVKRSLALQAEALDVKKEEIDRYVNQYRNEMEKERQALQETFLLKIDALYQDGVEFYGKKAYKFAHDIFLEVEKLQPDYKKTHYYLDELANYFRVQALDSPSAEIAVSEALDGF